jgi:hypothetical protein
MLGCLVLLLKQKSGRLAMIGFVAAVVTEVLTKQGVLHFWGLM